MFMATDHTAYGRQCQPLTVGNLKYRAEMKIDSKKVLWENVSALMLERYKKENLTKLSKDSGLGPGTMTRIKDQETSVGIDVLEKIAVIAKVEPWQLLCHGMGKSVSTPSKTTQSIEQNQPLAQENHAVYAIDNVAMTLEKFRVLITGADTLTRLQIKPLLEKLCDSPELSVEIMQHLGRALGSGNSTMADHAAVKSYSSGAK